MHSKPVIEKSERNDTNTKQAIKINHTPKAPPHLGGSPAEQSRMTSHHLALNPLLATSTYPHDIRSPQLPNPPESSHSNSTRKPTILPPQEQP